MLILFARFFFGCHFIACIFFLLSFYGGHFFVGCWFFFLRLSLLNGAKKNVC